MKGTFDRFLDRVENLDRDLFDPYTEIRRSRRGTRSNFWIQKRIHDRGRKREKKYDPLQKSKSSWGGIVLNESGVEALQS